MGRQEDEGSATRVVQEMYRFEITATEKTSTVARYLRYLNVDNIRGVPSRKAPGAYLTCGVVVH